MFLSFSDIIPIGDALHCRCWLPGGCSLKVSSIGCGDHFGRSDEGSSGRRKTMYETKGKTATGDIKGVNEKVLFAALL